MRILSTILMLLMANLMFAGDIYVSTTGSDRNTGTKGRPLATISRALRLAREWRRTSDARINGGITIHLAKGLYTQESTIYVRPEDSGTPQSPTIITCDNVGDAIISGGHLMESVPRGKRSAWQGDIKLYRVSAYPPNEMGRILGFDKVRETVTIPASAFSKFKTKNLEMILHQRWAIAILRIKNYKIVGNKAIVTFKNPESQLEFAHPWPQPIVDGDRGSSGFNIFSLDEWEIPEIECNPDDSEFLPNEHVTPRSSTGRSCPAVPEITVPMLSKLLLVEGYKSMPVHNVIFRNVAFADSDWHRPVELGHVTLQGGFPIIDAYKLTDNPGLPWATSLENQAWIERPEAAVTVRWARDVHFEKCKFTRLSSTAIDFEKGVHFSSLYNCRFHDIGGTAILCGSFGEGPTEVHRPMVIPNDEICDSIHIHANVVYDATNEDWGGVGIGCGYVSNAKICHNTISNVNYSGIAVGWGWTHAFTGMKNNVIEENYVSQYAKQLYDAGGIYTMSNQPNSVISGNVVAAPTHAPYATNYRAFPIYFDACTDGYTVQDNKLTTDELLTEKYGYNNPGPRLVIK